VLKPPVNQNPKPAQAEVSTALKLYVPPVQEVKQGKEATNLGKRKTTEAPPLFQAAKFNQGFESYEPRKRDAKD
jgi:hypothetical protein